MKKNAILYLGLLLAFVSCSDPLEIKEPGLLVPLTVMEDNLLPSIQVNDVRLHSETYGDPSNPMLVVIHGGPGADYRGILNFKELAEDSFYVVFYDQRGSGLSQRLEKDRYNEVQFFIDELDGVINHYRNNPSQKILLAGHSWGAMLATAYVNQNPEKIKGLILAEPGGLTWEQTEAYITRSRALKVFEETTNDFVYLDQFITGTDHNTLDYKMALSTAGEIGTGDPTTAPYWRFGSVCNMASIELAMDEPEQINFTGNLNAFNKKVLFAYSERNEAYGLEHAELVSEPFPIIELVEIAGCGHEMPHFGWNNLYPIIKNYLTEIL